MLDGLLRSAYLEKAVSMREVTIGVAALMKLLKQYRDAMPLGTFISLMKQAFWELQNTDYIKHWKMQTKKLKLKASVN